MSLVEQNLPRGERDGEEKKRGPAAPKRHWCLHDYRV